MEVSIYKSNNVYFLNGAIVPVNCYRCVFELINSVDVITIEDIRERARLLNRFPVTSITKESGAYYASKAEFIVDCGQLFCNIQTSVTITNDITLNGSPITGQSLETGGSNVLGWLSSIRKKISDLLTATTDGTQKTKITDNDGDVLDIYTRSQTPPQKVIGVQIGPGDVISNLPVIIDYDHHQLHEGETFRWSVYVSSLGTNANKDGRIVVPNINIPVGINPVQLCPHFRFEVISSGDALIYIHESTTFTANGTQRTPVALERNGTYTPKIQVYEDPTVNVLGSLIWQGLLTASKNVGGGISNSGNEFVLKNNTSYSFRVTSLGNSNKILIRYEWYEDLGV